MAMKMCVVVPSRGRPENADRLAKAFIDTNADADLYIVVDNDDPKWNEYAKMNLIQCCRQIIKQVVVPLLLIPVLS